MVRMQCSVTAQGSLTGCRIVSEDPSGQGFGAASLRMVNLFRMRPQTRDGTPVDGGSVTIPIRWNLGSG